MSSREVRKPGKQGSWYVYDPEELADQLQSFLQAVPDQIDGSSTPIPGARVIIAPHAGYSYSGPTAAWAYKSLDLSQAKRVFLLGPSHTFYLRGCALTGFKKYGTPFGNLDVDQEVVQKLRSDHSIPDMPASNDNKEHSLEMHLPYLWQMLLKAFGSPDKFPTLVPILVGDNNKAGEREAGSWLLPYLRDPTNAFIVSSDFCHWGDNFSYTPYSPEAKADDSMRHLSHRSRVSGRPIHETIKMLDDLVIDAIKTGEYEEFYDNLAATKNTVCGRHPIGVMMAALEALAAERGGDGGDDRGKFKFVRYERSNLVEEPGDFSVSYVSAYTVV